MLYPFENFNWLCIFARTRALKDIYTLEQRHKSWVVQVVCKCSIALLDCIRLKLSHYGRTTTQLPPLALLLSFGESVLLPVQVLFEEPMRNEEAFLRLVKLMVSTLHLRQRVAIKVKGSFALAECASLVLVSRLSLDDCAPQFQIPLIHSLVLAVEIVCD